MTPSEIMDQIAETLPWVDPAALALGRAACVCGAPLEATRVDDDGLLLAKHTTTAPFSKHQVCEHEYKGFWLDKNGMCGTYEDELMIRRPKKAETQS